MLAFSALDICSRRPSSTPSTIPLTSPTISPWNVSFKTAVSLSSSDSGMKMCDVDLFIFDLQIAPILPAKF